MNTFSIVPHSFFTLPQFTPPSGVGPLFAKESARVNVLEPQQTPDFFLFFCLQTADPCAQVFGRPHWPHCRATGHVCPPHACCCVEHSAQRLRGCRAGPAPAAAIMARRRKPPVSLRGKGSRQHVPLTLHLHLTATPWIRRRRSSSCLIISGTSTTFEMYARRQKLYSSVCLHIDEWFARSRTLT